MSNPNTQNSLYHQYIDKIDFLLNEDGTKLFVKIKSHEHKFTLARMPFIELLDEQGYNDLDYNDDNIEEFLNAARQGVTLKFEVAKNSHAELNTNPDNINFDLFINKINFNFDISGKILLGRLSSTNDKFNLPAEFFPRLLELIGYGDLEMNIPAFEEFSKAAKQGVLKEFAVAEKHDSEFELFISSDESVASGRIKPAKGGKDLQLSEVWDYLLQHNIDVTLIDKDKLQSIIANPGEPHVEFAHGIAPINGLDARFEILVDLDSFIEPTEDANGVIDYNERSNYVVIEEDVPVLKRCPPTLGQKGSTVFGAILDAKDGKNVEVNQFMEGLKPDPENEDIWLAAKQGHPVEIAGGLKIDSSLKLNNVNINTGNVTFDGSVKILGDVHAGLTVRASGDIFVDGVVEMASLYAGNDIIIQGGVLGDESKKGAQSSKEFSTHIHAGRDLSLGYSNICELMAGKDIRIKEYAFSSRIDAGQTIYAGQGGGKGRISGGTSKAKRSLVCNILGSEAFLSTNTIIGSQHAIKEEISHLKTSYHKRTNEINQLTSKMEALDEKEKNKIKKYEQAILSHQINLILVETRMEMLDKTTKNMSYRDQVIKVKKAAYPNIHMAFNGVKLNNKLEHKAVTFALKEGRIIVL